MTTLPKQLLRDLFRQDLAGALYLAADLEPGFFERCRWLADRDDRASAVVMIFLGLETPALVAFGDSAAMRQIVERHRRELPARCYAKLSRAQMPLFGELYDFSRPQDLDVMMLGDLAAPACPSGVVLRDLAPDDPLPPILDVYRGYAGHFFEPSQLATGRYAGAWMGNRLVAIAGTHAYAPGEGIAVLGNVTTAADVRGRGLATAVTAFLCGRLRASGCTHIGLHVERENAPAIAAYRRCGFTMADRPTILALAVGAEHAFSDR